MVRGPADYRLADAHAELSVSCQEFPSKNETAGCRKPAKCSENCREHRKLCWKQTEGSHEGDRLKAPRYACQIVDGLLPLACGHEAPPLGHDGEGEKSATVDDEAREQKRRRERVGMRTPRCKSQRHGSVNEEVERDIEEGTEIRALRCSRNSTVEAVGDAVRNE